ncbi:hypothetical protein BELL_0515g00020 [Botrytis elliptica]|uniref:Uncharacterized protein n=1 Tax=Botrytis elliptica TaxID=278938 RepID=A0A4Z1JDT2_9HELO|nr:hypothetical protein BELL_0515g00020 [Botrytis elliptica]
MKFFTAPQYHNASRDKFTALAYYKKKLAGAHYTVEALDVNSSTASSVVASISSPTMPDNEFATNDELITAVTGRASTTESAQGYDRRQLTRGERFGAVICEPVAFNWLIGMILVFFCR